jgi:hypothetical protein
MKDTKEDITKELAINTIIASGCDTNEISDGYHTFGELYDHRISLFIALARRYSGHPKMKGEVWRSQNHSDGSGISGWFILGMFTKASKQITYHIPISRWTECGFAEILKFAPEWDGHTSKDVIERLKNL